MARVLVIGGTLFIGRTLVELLLDRNHDVVIMHRGNKHPFDSRVGEIRCDRNDVDAVRTELQRERFDIVFDNVYDWDRGTSPEQVLAAVNAASPGLRRYVFTSSVAVYPEGGEYDEDAPLVPPTHPNRYGAQKAATERALFELHRQSGVPVSTVRPSFIYGPNNPFEREAFFWDRIRDGRPIIVPDDGSRTLQWVHVDDVARTAMLAAESERAVGRAYNLGNYPPVTQVEFVELLARVAGKPVRLAHIPRDEIMRAGGNTFAPPLYFGIYLDIPPITVRVDRARSELGLDPIPLEDGLRQTYLWYTRQQRPKPDYSWEDSLIASVR